MASVSAPEAFSAKFSARRASAGPNADAARAYRLRAPTGLPSAFSGRARQDRIPCEAACASNSGQPAWSAVSSMRTMWRSRMACRHGPSSSLYCTSSTCAATGSLHATVTGLPFGCMVIPHDRPPPTRRAASTAISCRNCSTLWVLSKAPCRSLRSPASVNSAVTFASRSLFIRYTHLMDAHPAHLALFSFSVSYPLPADQTLSIPGPAQGLSAPARPIWPYLRVGRLEDGRADSQTGVLSPAATVHMIDYVFDLSLYSRKFTSP